MSNSSNTIGRGEDESNIVISELRDSQDEDMDDDKENEEELPRKNRN